MENKPFWTKVIANSGAFTTLPTTAIQIENTSALGVVTVTNGNGNADQTFTLSAGKIQVISGSWTNAPMTITCDGDATCQIIYQR